MSKLTNKLQEAVKKLSYKTTVDQLRRKGIQKVNVVGLDRIVALIEAAVHRTLKARMAGFAGFEARGEIAGATRDEFLKLLQSNESLERARGEVEHEKADLQAEVTRLRLELQASQGRIAEREAAYAREAKVRAAADDQELHGEIESMLESLGVSGDEGTRRAIEEVRGLFQHRLDAARRTVAEARRREYQNEVDLLNRRLAKLNGTLAATEGELKRVMQAKSIDPGIASVFKEVQGLQHDDAQFEQKRGLMTSIFEANLKLQKIG